MRRLGTEVGAPLVLAFSLPEAREALAASGWECAAVAVTARPPRRGDAAPEEGAGSGEAPREDDLLVVRQQALAGRAVRLTVARHPGGPAAGSPGGTAR